MHRSAPGSPSTASLTILFIEQLVGGQACTAVFVAVLKVVETSTGGGNDSGLACAEEVMESLSGLVRTPSSCPEAPGTRCDHRAMGYVLSVPDIDRTR